MFSESRKKLNEMKLALNTPYYLPTNAELFQLMQQRFTLQKATFFLRNTYFFRNNATHERTTKGSRNRLRMRFAA